MKVLQINAVFEKYSTGRLTMELHEGMIKEGIESYIAAINVDGTCPNMYKIGNLMDRKVHALLSRVFGRQGYFSVISTVRLLSYIDRINPDIIHLHNLHSNYINFPILFKYIAKKKIPTVLTLHDNWFYTGKCVYYIECNCSKWLEGCGNCPALHRGNPSLFFDTTKSVLKTKRKLYSKIDKLGVIGVSKWVTDDASKSILKNAKVIKCIYNWIDLDVFSPKENSLELRNTMKLSDKFVILGVSVDWTPEKGIDVFNELADILPDEYQIILVGNCNSSRVINSKIKCVGRVNNPSELADYYSMADVFVNPSIQETFGKTTAEAMSCGTTVIAYNGTATPELIGTDGKCGFLIDGNNVNEYYEKIKEIKRIGKHTFGENSRKRAEMLFSKEKNLQEYFNVYYELSND